MRIEKPTILSSLLRSYRKLRLIIKSILYLPSHVMIVANNSEAKINTRGWPTANVALWLKTKGLLKNNIMDYEPEESGLLKSKFTNSESFWDIGAQIGYYSILAALSGVKNVIAIDIDSRYCDEIKKHANQNNLNIITMCVATGISGKDVEFNNYARTTKRKAVSIDEIWEKTGLKPDLIKIDIDGGEYDTVCGGGRLLSLKDAPDLFIEVLEQHSDVDKLMHKIRSYGYKIVERRGNNVFFSK